MQVLAGPRAAVKRVSLSGCGRWVGVDHGVGVARLLDRSTGRPAYTWAFPTDADPFDEETWFLPDGAVVLPDGRQFVCWGMDRLLVVSTSDGSAELVPVDGQVWGVHPTPDGRWLFVRLSDGSRQAVAGWTWEAGRPREEWRHRPTGTAHGFGYDAAPGGGWVVCHTLPAWAAERVSLHRGADGERLASLPAPPNYRLVGCTDDGRAVGRVGPRVLVTDVARRQTVETRLPGRGAVAAAVVTPSGDLLAAHGWHVYHLTVDPPAVRRAYTFPVKGKPTCLAVAPDGLTAACGTSTGEVVVWDLD